MMSIFSKNNVNGNDSESSRFSFFKWVMFIIGILKIVDLLIENRSLKKDNERLNNLNIFKDGKLSAIERINHSKNR